MNLINDDYRPIRRKTSVIEQVKATVLFYILAAVLVAFAAGYWLASVEGDRIVTGN